MMINLWIAIANAIGAGPNIGASIVEVYDRVTEDGIDRRKTEDDLNDRETEGAP
jgi:hypothetical protein